MPSSKKESSKKKNTLEVALLLLGAVYALPFLEHYWKQKR